LSALKRITLILTVAILMATAALVGSGVSAQAQTPLSNDDYYLNSDGVRVHSPAYSLDGSIPEGATAQCADGMYSFSLHDRGTCSGHGGVWQWL
jgi:hypothetical protein